MAFSYNRVMLAGNLTRDPVTRFLANEKAVANFGLAVSRRFKGSDGEMKEDTLFIDVEAWGRTAELVGQYLLKGRSCFIEGRLRLEQWDDKTTGQKRNKIVVVADNVQFTGPNPNRQGGAGGEGGHAAGDMDDAPPAPSSAKSSAAPAAGGEDEPPF